MDVRVNLEPILYPAGALDAALDRERLDAALAAAGSVPAERVLLRHAEAALARMDRDTAALPMAALCG